MFKTIGMIIGFILISLNIYSQTYDFDKFIELVKSNNRDIMIAAKELDMAKAQEREAKSNVYPQISLEGNYKRNLNKGYMYVDLGEGTQKLSITYDNEFDMQAVLSQQLFNASIFKAIKAANQYEKLSGFVYDATFQGIIAGSKKAFYQTLLLKEVWNVENEALKNAKENYDETANKYDNGLVSQFEMLQAEVRWKNQIPTATQAERNYRLSLNTLKVLAGIPVENDFIIEGDIETAERDVKEIDMPEILNNRPDYKALLWEEKLRNTNISAEYSGHLPSLFASFTYDFNSVSNEFSFDNKNNYLIAGLTLKVPIFDGWNTSAKVQQAEIELTKTKIEIEKTREDIKKDIQNTSLRIAEAQNRIESAEQTLKTAKKGFEIAEATADNGLATQLELKDARINYDQAQLNYYSAVYDYLEAYFDWELAAGLTETK